MKKLLNLITIFPLILFENSFCQNIINPYFTGYSNVLGLDINNPTDPQYHRSSDNLKVYDSYNQHAFNTSNQYIGEYIIFFQDGIQSTGNQNWHSTLEDHALSYKIEAASFPFTINCFDNPPYCGYDPFLNPTAPEFERKLYMPDDPFNATYNGWGYLRNRAVGDFVNAGPGRRINGDFTLNERGALVSSDFVSAGTNAFVNNRQYLPHTVLRHVVYIHCDLSFNSDILDSIVWIYDNTRGRMRNYPFVNSNDANSTCAACWDVAYFPEIIQKPDDPTTTGSSNDFHSYNESDNNGWIDGGTPNYFNFIPASAFSCSGAGNYFSPTTNENFYEGDISTFDFGRPAPYSLYNTFLRNSVGSALAGYDEYQAAVGGPHQMYINSDKVGIKHDYFINHGFPDLDLTLINPFEKTIYNPSEVTIKPDAGASPINVIFPDGYTFKTVLGRYPSHAQAVAANTTDNGGIYSELRDVPVPTTAGTSGSNTDPELLWDDPGTTDINNFFNDERFGYYYIENDAILSVGTCVKIFDARFEVRPGGTLLFYDHTLITGKEDKSSNFGRYKIRCEGGAVLRNQDAVQYVQNGAITQTQQLLYTATNKIEAGYEVDPDNDAPKGNYELENNSDVVFLADNNVYLKPGFRAKEGSTFHAYCATIGVSTPCPPTPNRLSDNSQNNKNNSSHRAPFILSPNPSTGKFTLYQSSHTDINGKIGVSDAMGKSIYESTIQSHSKVELNLSDEPKGVYFVKIIEGDHVSTNKIIVQ